ncbi:parallel beta helix pectate lyase-like protein [Geothermobacter ehrlichii]|uniref:Parallel beta helix pectate lyase-like protein n=1 Tax=Geothermobacter ehrlichii TaxID=213224 RepID=A0A5D3WI17_9BACT|nr:right-handed parallel beta-helix repeat-containing protein [Geothermobacter ehrlichii]TYO97117.1 parallel beta helix pectate lyase-like protein [Geothermobacter ehrlichii]
MRRLLWILVVLLLAGCAGRPAPVLELADTAISGDVVWQGEVRIRGVVTVKKSGRLTILPGTRVVFLPLDRDGDGIGDSELYVEGEIVAEGTAQAPILLTSGASRPQPADWKYLYCDFARRVSLRHVISEYAYSGVQVHFCKARIADSEFRFNVDGVRFSTVNLELSGNRIHHNRHGLRFEERRSTGRIHHNQISDNEIGLFVVTRSRGGILIERNNIVGSRSYQVKFGLQQRQDVPLPRNWWGTIDRGRLEEQLFDGRRDPALGRALIVEPLAAPVAIP